MSLDFKPMGDSAIRVGMGTEIHPATHQRIRRFCGRLEQEQWPGVVEWIPTYTAVTIFYRPHLIGYTELCRALSTLEVKESSAPIPPAEVVVLPCLYGGAWGPDLPYVAECHRLTPQQVIEIHGQPLYLIYMLGFLPGFPYLGGMDERIATPRLENPRAVTPAGAVGIAGSQTGVYPVASPGGWRIIGRTPVPLFDPRRQPPVALKAGDYVRFAAVEEAEFLRIERRIVQGEYALERHAYSHGSAQP